jgi:hypothetical protein
VLITFTTQLKGAVKKDPGTEMETTYVVPSDINLRKSPKSVTFRTGLDHFLECQIHPRVAVDQVAIQSLAILELDEHRMTLRCSEKTQGKLWH